MKKTLVFIGLSLLLTGCGATTPQKPATTNEGKLAQCLTEKGVKMYGTLWCPHCNDQKKAFGTEQKYIPFIDCDKRTGLCQKEKITGYPTWVFEDGKRLAGKQDLATLAESAQCEYSVE